MEHHQEMIRGFAAVLPIVVALGLGASPARAGYWMRSSCINPGGAAASSEGWSGTSQYATYGSTNNVACGPGGPMVALLSTAAGAPVGAHQTLVYTPPAGSTLSGGVVGGGLLPAGNRKTPTGVAPD
jgi:hypothetical protein